jgi:hypothetical protein
LLVLLVGVVLLLVLLVLLVGVVLLLVLLVRCVLPAGTRVRGRGAGRGCRGDAARDEQDGERQRGESFRAHAALGTRRRPHFDPGGRGAGFRPF